MDTNSIKVSCFPDMVDPRIDTVNFPLYSPIQEAVPVLFSLT